MTFMNITEINNILKSKRPAAKAPTGATREADITALGARIADARKALNRMLAQAELLGASRVAEQARCLSAKLGAVEAQLASARGEARLVALRAKVPNN
jgi:hypothetical protein